MGPYFKSSLLALFPLAWQATATITLGETSTTYTLENDRLKAVVARPGGKITSITLDGTSLLGTGQGLYLDCYCIPSGFYTPGSTSPTLELLNGTDSTGTKWGGVALRETYKPTGQAFEQLWFLRDGETGLHSFTRTAYFNESVPFLRNLQELRTLFRPTSSLWTHLSTNQKQWGPLPSKAAVAAEVVAQDATWYLGNTPNDSYVQQVADYFTKYTFADSWRDHKAHGLYADGSTSNGTAYGAWLVMNTRDTYFGGPLHSDLTVDGITYNYIISNHHGDGTPNIAHGYDRTYGPFYYHFNSGKGASLANLRADAEKLADPTWNAAFYDDIAQHVPNYVTTSGRGTFKAKINLPKGAKKPIAILSVSGYDFQANEVDTKALQYWGDIESDGSIEIPRVKAGNYRLTVYADGIFGQYIQDNITVKAGNVNSVEKVTWKEESAGKELWRLGTPDKTAGEFRHGFAGDPSKTLHPEEYRIYWGYHDFPTDFPNGVNFTIGKSDIAKDWNYIHWSVFGPSYTRKNAVWDSMNNWTINFDYSRKSSKANSTATFTVQLAGAKTASGNTDVDNGAYTNFDLNVVVNGNSPLPFHIPWYQSSSCGVRSGISCYNLGEKLKFPEAWLKNGHNSIVLSLPFNATDIETAVLPGSIYVQYDALRLEGAQRRELTPPHVMKSLALGFVWSLAVGASAKSIYEICQSTQGKKSNPTAGCPTGTKYVSLNDTRADFKSIQAAVLSLPQDTSPQWILAGAGVYKEAINVTRKGPTTLLGATNHADKYVQNLVTIYNTTFMNQTTQTADQDNADTQVLTVAPNKWSTWTGKGFYGDTPEPVPNEWGCTDFRAYNINFENRAATKAVGPALAVGVAFARASFYGCTFKSYQDTVFIGKNGSAVFKRSEVAGSTDYIYGFGKAYFLESTLSNRGPGRLTAWKGDDRYKNTNGAYFDKCRIVKSPDADPSLSLVGTMGLGRPWNNLSTVAIMDTYMDNTVMPAGYTIWGTTDPRFDYNVTYFAEYKSYGPGWNATARDTSVERILTTAKEVKRFSLGSIFGADLTWIDFSY